MAFGATEGRAQPSSRDGAHAFGAVLGQILLGLRTAFAGHHVEAVIAGGDFLLLRGVGEEVAGQLFAGERVEGLVRVERVDDVVAVGEDALVLVAVEADGVREAGDIQPPHGHALAVVRRSEQAVDLLFVGVRRGVGEEGREFFRGRRQAGQVEREAAEELFLGGFRRGGDFLGG